MDADADNHNRPHLFTAKVVNVSILASLLKSVSFGDKVNVLITSAGAKFTVEEGKYVQASAFLRRDSFDEYTLENSNEDIEFRIPLKELLDFLKIFLHGHNEGKFKDSSTAITMHNTNQPTSPTKATLLIKYEYEGGPFVLILDEGATITDFLIKTEDVDDLMELSVDDPSCELILKSEPLRDLLTEIEGNVPEHLKIKVVPDTKLQFSGKGISGDMKIIIPHTSTDVIELFDCKELTKSSYRFSVFKYSLKALQLSEKVAFKIGAEGLLCMSFLMTANTESYVEFYCMSQVPDEEIDD